MTSSGDIDTEPIDRVNDAVLKALGGDALRPAVVSAIMDGFLEQLLPANIENRVDDLRRRLTVLEAKIHNLTDVVEQGGADLPSIIERLSERKKEREALLMEMGSAETLHQIQVDRAAIKPRCRPRWRTGEGC
jgi:hypothetical protein